MKNKILFENVGGNQFKLISENVNQASKTDMVREGLKKIFESANGKPLTYKSLANVGMGYIKDVGEARKCALQEARYIAEAFGYMENADQQAFVKEIESENNPQPDATSGNPSQIGQQKLKVFPANKSKTFLLRYKYSPKSGLTIHLSRLYITNQHKVEVCSK